MKNLILIAIFLAIILGFLYPKGTIFQSLILPLSAIMMYISVLEADIKFKNFLRKDLIYWVLINLVIQPIFAYFIGSFFIKDLRLGIFLAAIAPSGINSPVFINLLDGDTQLGVSTSILANTFAMIFIPVFLFIFFGMKISIPYNQILITIFGLSLIPITLAILTKKFLSNFHKKILKFSDIILSLSFFIILWVIFSSVSGSNSFCWLFFWLYF
ncbi:MAG: hypothetical protein NTW30_03535 [Candidatus Aenigmarchaeota archaeon]|nr:hypothetical protein [Candidatus Aenigmarchaeota archaeon]